MHEDLIAELRRGSFNHEHDAAMHAAADALEAMQADAERMDWLESTVRHYGDGRMEPHEAVIGWIGWQQTAEQTQFPGLRAAIDAARKQP